MGKPVILSLSRHPTSLMFGTIIEKSSRAVTEEAFPATANRKFLRAQPPYCRYSRAEFLINDSLTHISIRAPLAPLSKMLRKS